LKSDLQRQDRSGITNYHWVLDSLLTWFRQSWRTPTRLNRLEAQSLFWYTATMTPLKLLIVDDHPVFRQGLHDVFETEAKILVVGEAADGEEALAQIKDVQPDVVLMDINLPTTSGLQVTRNITKEMPQIKVVMITGYDEPEYIYHSLRAGASAFCSKDLPPETLIRTVFTVYDGNYVINDQVLNEEQLSTWLEKRKSRFGRQGAQVGSDSAVSLSPREMEILELICQGISNKDIAKRLGISYQTVKNHVTAVLHKLGVSDRTQAVLYALKHGWFTIESM
jgi:DNA-binding NarL/FixJ family response regulator